MLSRHWRSSPHSSRVGTIKVTSGGLDGRGRRTRNVPWTGPASTFADGSSRAAGVRRAERAVGERRGRPGPGNVPGPPPSPVEPTARHLDRTHPGRMWTAPPVPRKHPAQDDLFELRADRRRQSIAGPRNAPLLRGAPGFRESASAQLRSSLQLLGDQQLRRGPCPRGADRAAQQRRRGDEPRLALRDGRARAPSPDRGRGREAVLSRWILAARRRHRRPGWRGRPQPQVPAGRRTRVFLPGTARAKPVRRDCRVPGCPPRPLSPAGWAGRREPSRRVQRCRLLLATPRGRIPQRLDSVRGVAAPRVGQPGHREHDGEASARRARDRVHEVALGIEPAARPLLQPEPHAPQRELRPGVAPARAQALACRSRGRNGTTMSHLAGGAEPTVIAPGPQGSRAAATLRFGISIAVSAAVTAFVFWLLPRRLSVVTDVVGHPIHSNFNYKPYFWRYYLGVLFAPALAAAVYHFVGLRWPQWRWPDSAARPAPEVVDEPPRRTVVLEQGRRALAVGATFGLGFILLDPRGSARFRRAQGLARLRRIEAQHVLLVAVPIVLWLYTATLPFAISGLDSFHSGEFIAGAWLFSTGAFPWRDLFFIHGLLQDIFTPLAGFKLFGDSIWGGSAGSAMLLAPLWWTTTYLLFLYLFRRNVPLLIAAVADPVLGAYMDGHWRFAPLSLILLALAALLERATWPRAFLLAVALVASNVLVPELASAVPACGAALVGFELTHAQRDRGFFGNLPRTIRVVLSGLIVLALGIAYLARHHAVSAFLDYYAAFAPDHALTGAIPHGKEWNFLVYMFLPPLLLLLAFWYAVAAVRMRWVLDVRDWVMAALAIVTLLYYGKFLSRADWHLLQAVSPALPLLYYALDKILAISGLRSRRALVATAGIVVLATILFTPGRVADSLSRVPSNFIRVVPNQPVLAELGWSEPAMANQAAGWTELRRFLDASLDAGDTLFDFSNQPALYHYLLRRKPATRYYHVSMAIRRSVQLDLIQELEKARPKLVVFDTKSGGLPAWDGVTNEVRHYEVSSYILRRYKPFARLQGQVFYLRNDLVLDPMPPTRSFEVLRVPDAYARARACNWGYAPGFMRTDWLDPGPFAEQRQPAFARWLAVSGWAADARTLQPAREVMLFARGMLLARTVPASERPDVARVLGSAALERSGFSMSRESTDNEQFQWNDLRAYGISQDGKASPLETTWPSRGDGPPDLRLDSRTSIPVAPGAARGWVDQAEVEEAERIAPFEFPAGTLVPGSSGLELNVDVSRNAILIVSDQPFVPADGSGAQSQPAPWGLVFRVAAPFSGNIRVMMENCPQWHALSGRTLYLRYGDGVTVHRLSLLLRHRPQPE